LGGGGGSSNLVPEREGIKKSTWQKSIFYSKKIFF